MAINGSKNFYVTDYDKLLFEWKQVEQNVATNTTKISWSLKLVATSYGKIVASGTQPFYVQINSNKKTQNVSISINNNETKALLSGTEIIAHNSDGTGSFNFEVSGTFNMTFSNKFVGTIKGTGTGTLNKINRISTLNKINDFDLDKETTISFSKYISSYQNNLVIKAKNTTIKTINSIPNNYKLKFDDVELINIYNQYPHTEKCNLDFCLNTLDSSNKNLGESIQSSIGTIPESVLPIIHSISKKEANKENSLDEFIKGISKLNVVVSGNASTGSVLTSTKIKIGGVLYNGYNITTNILEQDGSVPVEVEIADSRGRTTKKTETISVLSYDKPKINNFSIKRCDENQVVSNLGNCVLINLDCSASSINLKNDFNIKIKYKKTSESTFSELVAPTALPSTQTKIFIDDISTDYTYDFKIEVSDSFNEVSKSIVVPTAYVLVDFLNGGKGMSFGKVAEEEDLIDFNIQSKYRKNLVLENGVTVYSKQADEKLVNLLGLSKSNNAFIGSMSSNTCYEGDLNFYAGRNLNFYANRVIGSAGCALAFGDDGNTTSLKSEVDSKIYLGSATNRFNTAYFVNQITASDSKEKEEVELKNFNAKDFVLGLKPKAYRRISNFDRGVRTHFGFYAQDINDLIKFKDFGDLALVQATKKDGTAFFGENEDDSNLIWGINYSELIAPVVKTIQEQQKEIDELKEEILKLKKLE